MNHARALDKDVLKLQLEVRMHGNTAPSPEWNAKYNAILNTHLDIITGVRGETVVREYTTMLSLPLSSVHGQHLEAIEQETTSS